MKNEYTDMWRGLGLHIENHAGLLGILSEAVPFLRIETEYSTEDAGQLTTRVEAFLEMIR
ncbi:MAG: 2-hydroxyacyl-CoA dehydratase family protein [Candidatus Deferrimicrobiota bacterium]